jgi:hypothetical protein
VPRPGGVVRKDRHYDRCRSKVADLHDAERRITTVRRFDDEHQDQAEDDHTEGYQDDPHPCLESVGQPREHDQSGTPDHVNGHGVKVCVVRLVAERLNDEWKEDAKSAAGETGDSVGWPQEPCIEVSADNQSHLGWWDLLLAWGSKRVTLKLTNLPVSESEDDVPLGNPLLLVILPTGIAEHPVDRKSFFVGIEEPGLRGV